MQDIVDTSKIRTRYVQGTYLSSSSEMYRLRGISRMANARFLKNLINWYDEPRWENVYIRSRDAREIQYPPYIKSAADILNTDKTIDLIWGTVLSDILVDGKTSGMRVTQSWAPFFIFQFLPGMNMQPGVRAKSQTMREEVSMHMRIRRQFSLRERQLLTIAILNHASTQVLRPYILALWSWSWNGEPGMYKLKFPGGLEAVALYQGAFGVDGL